MAGNPCAGKHPKPEKPDGSYDTAGAIEAVASAGLMPGLKNLEKIAVVLRFWVVVCRISCFFPLSLLKICYVFLQVFLGQVFVGFCLGLLLG